MDNLGHAGIGIGVIEAVALLRVEEGLHNVLLEGNAGHTDGDDCAADELVTDEVNAFGEDTAQDEKALHVGAGFKLFEEFAAVAVRGGWPLDEDGVGIFFLVELGNLV